MVVWGNRALSRRAPGVSAENAYQSESYMSALQEVREGLCRGEGIIVITGKSGTGKTLLCRGLAEMGDTRTFTSFVVDPYDSAEGLLLQILGDFGVVNPSARLTRDEAIRVLQRFIASLVPLRSRAVVIIDEAHRLQPEVADVVRVLSNFETGGQRLLQVVLAGQPELDRMLERPDLQRLAQRVARRVELAPLTPREIAAYVEHRLSFAGGNGASWEEHVVLESGPGYNNVVTVQVPTARAAALSDLWFTTPAIRALERVSNGVPATINAVFDHAVRLAAERQTTQIDRALIREAGKRVVPRTRYPVPKLTQRTGVAAAVIAAVAVTGAAAWARAGVGTPSMRAAVVAHSSPAATPASPALPLGVTQNEAMQSLPVQTANSVTISIASFRTEERARSVAAQLVDAGFPAFVRPRGDGLWQQVIVGPYVSQGEAAAAQRAMAAQGVQGTEVRIEKTDLQP